jgi:hypothetical protein
MFGCSRLRGALGADGPQTLTLDWGGCFGLRVLAEGLSVPIRPRHVVIRPSKTSAGLESECPPHPLEQLKAS